MGALRYLFSFKGRIGRAKMWLFVPISLAVEIAVSALSPQPDTANIYLAIANFLFCLPPAGVSPVWYASTAVSLTMVWADLAITLKRLHDRDKGAPWLALMWVVPNLSSLLVFYRFGLLSDSLPRHPEFTGWQQWGAIVLSMISLWVFIELYCRRGSHGENRFGPDPRGGPPYCTPENPSPGCIPKPD